MRRTPKRWWATGDEAGVGAVPLISASERVSAAKAAAIWFENERMAVMGPGPLGFE
jgi:hypothetical protein